MVGRGKLLKIYLGENERYHGKPLYQHLVRWLKERGVAGATVCRGIEGYGQDKILHTARLLELSADLPVILEVVDTPEKIGALVPEIVKLVPKGLVFTADVEIHKYGK